MNKIQLVSKTRKQKTHETRLHLASTPNGMDQMQLGTWTVLRIYSLLYSTCMLHCTKMKFSVNDFLSKYEKKKNTMIKCFAKIVNG